MVGCSLPYQYRGPLAMRISSEEQLEEITELTFLKSYVQTQLDRTTGTLHESLEGVLDVVERCIRRAKEGKSNGKA